MKIPRFKHVKTDPTLHKESAQDNQVITEDVCVLLNKFTTRSKPVFVSPHGAW